MTEQICPKKPASESCWAVMLQVFPTYLVAGLGMVAAGLVLNQVQSWCVFTECGVMVMVPALLGLKGNLEMTLASRLSTAANLGRLDASMVLGNLVLVQCQGIVVGCLAALASMLLVWLPAGGMKGGAALLLITSAVTTASIASLLLGIVMVGVVLLSSKLRYNPDNVATPIAASLGDVTTLGLLAGIAELLYQHMKEDRYTALALLVAYFLLLPGLLYIAYRNEHTSSVLCTGWSPVLLAMLISSGGGMILDQAVKKFRGIAVFSPVMNGAGGNLVAIQASRMSTYLNAATNSLFGVFPPGEGRVCVLPCTALCSGYRGCGDPAVGHTHASMARILLLLLLPGHLIFLSAICFLDSLGSPTVLFISFYLLAALAQVGLLLYLCQVMVYWMWSRGTDPDNAAIPFLTAIGDLLGTAFLALCFLVLQQAEDPFLAGIETENLPGLQANLTEPACQDFLST